MSYTDSRTWLGFDVESSGDLPEYGLQPWSGRSWLTSFSVARPDPAQPKRLSTNAWPSGPDDYEDDIWEARLRASAKAFCEAAMKPGIVVVGWNVAFDAAWLIKMGFRDEVLAIRWLDGMLAWKHLERIPESDLVRAKRKQYGLKVAVEKFLPKYAGYGDDVDFHSMDRHAIIERLKYNRLDAGLTFRITRMLMQQLNQPQHKRQLRSLLLECQCIPLIADHYMTGIHVDQEESTGLGRRIDSEVAMLKSKLEEHGATEKVLASPAQLASLLYEDWMLPILKETPKGAPSTDKEALYELAFMDERAALIKRYRELKMLKTKFVTNVLESCRYNDDGVSHPTAIISGTYTGRMTFASSVGKNKEKRQTGFAIHQMKRSAEFRRQFIAPPGYTLVEWDAAGQEYRWVAIESGDATMLSLCEPGQDPHSYMGAEMTDFTYQQLRELVRDGDKTAKDSRMAGKVGNLSCQYRIGPKSLLSTARVQYDLPWDMAMSEYVHATYHRTYPGVKKYWRRKIREAQQVGYAETIAGRRVIVEGNWYGPKSWMLESTAINFPIQGVGADQKYLAMMCIQPLLKRYDGKFYFELHDGLYAIFPHAKAEKAAYEGRRLLSNLPYTKAWGFTPPIPLPWDLKIGPSWGDLEEKE